MDETPPRTRRSPSTPLGLNRGRLLGAGVVLLVLALAFVAVIHTPPVRRAVLRRAIATLEDRLGVHLTADDLRYNLLSLRVTLTNVRLAARDAHDTPFFIADRLVLSVPRSALAGPFALDEVAVGTARVHVVRHRDGTTNLPSPSADSGGEPDPLPLRLLTVQRLAIDFEDEVNDVEIVLPSVRVALGRDEGRIDAAEPMRITAGMQTDIFPLGGYATFDGRALSLRDFRVAAPEGALVVDGSIGLLVEAPGVDLKVTGTADAARIARWATAEEVPQGRVAIDGTVRGPFSAPAFAGSVRSDRLDWQELTIGDVHATLRASADVLTVARFDAAVANGRMAIAGDVPFNDANTRLHASWTDIDTAALMAMAARDVTPRVSGVASGSMEASGPGFDVGRWTIQATNRMRAGRPVRNAVATSGTMTFGLEDGRWRLQATHTVAGAPVRAVLNGRLNADRLAASTVAGTLDVPETDLRALVRAVEQAGLATGLRDVIDRGTARIDTRVTGTLSSPHVQATMIARNVDAASITGVSLDATVVGTTRQLQFDARARQAEGNILVASAAIRPGADHVTFRINGRLQDFPALTGDARLAGTADVDFAGEGPFDALVGQGRLTMHAARYAEFAVGDVDSTIELQQSRARIVATAADFALRANATIGIDAPYPATVDVEMNDADLARLLQGVEMPTPVTGRVGLIAHATGPLEDPLRSTASVEVRRLDAKAGDLPIRLTAPARATVANRIFDVASLEADAGDTHIALAGRLPLVADVPPVPDASALRATITGDLGEAARALAATRLVDVSSISGSGPVALLARVGGSVERPDVDADLELGPGSVSVEDLPPVTNLKLRVHMDEGWIDLREAAGQWQGATIDATGRVPTPLVIPRAAPGGDVANVASGRDAAKAASLQARVTSVTPEVLEPFLDAETLSQLQGRVDLSVQLQSPSLDLADVRGEVRLDQLDLRIANLPVVQREPTRIELANGFARVAAWDWTGQGATLGVRGQVRLEDRQAALLANGSIDLRMLTPFVRDAGLSTAGRLEPRLSITGPIDNPRVDGVMTLEAGEARLADPRVLVSDLAARAVITRTSATIVSLTGHVNGGRLTGGGEIGFMPGEPLAVLLNVDTRGVAMELPEGLRSELNAALQIALTSSGAGEPSGRLTGTVTVIRGAYREPLAVAAGLLAGLRAGRVAASVTPASSLLDRLALDIRVVTEEDLIVDNNYGRLQLGADLRVIGTAAAPSLSGRAELREGGQLFLGRNIYTIETGTIDFANPVTIEPDFSITARTHAGGEEIVLTLEGTPERLETELSAPAAAEPLGTADLASLLLTGRRLDEVTGDEAEILGEQVLGYLSGDVLGLASRAVGLDTIRLGGIDSSALRRDPTAIASELDPTTRLTFGKSLGPDVDVTFSQSLREGDKQTWIVDYVPRRQLELRLVSNDEDLRSYEFRHDVSFGGRAESVPRASTPERRADRIASVAITGTIGVPEARLRDVIRLQESDRFDFPEWLRDRDRLEAFYAQQGYREARVSPARQDVPTGVALTWAIDAGPTTTIVVSGAELPAAAIREIESAWTQSVFDDFLVADVEAIVRRVLVADGYVRATVKAAMSANPGSKTLTIDVDRGDRIASRQVEFRGVDDRLARELDAWTQQTDEVLVWRDPAAFERALVDHLRTRGYLGGRAKVGEPRFEGSTAIVPVEVNAGARFTVSAVVFEGVDGADEDVLRGTAGVVEGEPYDPAIVDAARGRLTAWYRREGFSDARVSVRQTPEEEQAAVNVTFEIEAGPRQVLHEIDVRGNRAIDTDVIVRTLALQVGEPLGAGDWLQARKRLFDTGLFRRVDIAAEPVDNGKMSPGPMTESVRARVTVQEWPALRLRYGFELAEERPEGEVEGRDLVPGLSADVTRRTLFGRAVTLGAALQYQRRERLGRTFLSGPTMFGWPVRSSLVVERAREEFAAVTLITDRSSVAWEQRFDFARNLELSYSYRFERNHTFDTDPNPDFPFDLTVNVARLNWATVFDTRDDPSDTSRGMLLSSNLEYAPASLGSEFRFVRYLAQAYYFKPWRDVVFASAGRFGLARPLAGQDLILSERFFAGGARTVRGAREDSLGPIAFGEPDGGQALLVLNQEIRVPIYGWLHGVGFVDAGNVFATPSDLRVWDLVGSVGAGLRLDTPFALLRVDYGRRLSPGSADRSGRWYFGIGQTF